MDFKYHLETAWSLTLKHIASLIFLTLTAVAVSVVSLGFLAPVVMAGYMQSILLLVRDGREPAVQDVGKIIDVRVYELCLDAELRAEGAGKRDRLVG